MKKTHKKIDKQICQTLTVACETAKIEVSGFQWLTHQVNYDQFPNSLFISCIFDSNTSLAQALQESKDQIIFDLINKALKDIDINLKDIKHHISFDTEQTYHVKNNNRTKSQHRLN